MSSDSDENELTSEDKRILKYVVDAARDEMPSRRGFIQGGTAAAAIGALGFGTGQATAQTQQAAGQVGTENNPADVEAATVNAAQEIITTAGKRLNPPDRPAVSESDQTVSVDLSDTVTVSHDGSDYEVYRLPIPREVNHRIRYEFPTGSHGNVHIYVPPFTIGDIETGGSGQGPLVGVRVVGGDSSTRTDYVYGSALVASCEGAQSPKIFGLNFVGEVPFINESAAVAFFGCDHASLDQCSFENNSGAEVGVLTYGSDISIEGPTHVGDGDLAQGSYHKHGGSATLVNGGFEGSVTSWLINHNEGDARIKHNSATADGELIRDSYPVAGTVGINGGIAASGESPQDITSDVSFGETTTNDRHGPIEVAVMISNDGGPIDVSMTVDGVKVDQYGNDNSPSVHSTALSARVPKGSDWVVDANGNESIDGATRYAITYKPL